MFKACRRLRKEFFLRELRHLRFSTNPPKPCKSTSIKTGSNTAHTQSSNSTSMFNKATLPLLTTLVMTAKTG